MQILKRAKGNSGEIVPFGKPPAGYQDEINHRTWKAGHTNREGGPRGATKIMTTVEFGERKYNLWPRDENGNLIDD